MHLVSFFYTNISRCTVLRMSKTKLSRQCDLEYGMGKDFSEGMFGTLEGTTSEFTWRRS